MSSFKTRDRPRKSKRRFNKKVTVIITALVCVLSLGLVASLSSFSISGSESLDGNSSHNGKPLPEQAPMTRYRILSEQFFSEPYTASSSLLDYNVIPGVNTSDATFGTVSTSKGYLEYKSTSSDVGPASESVISLYLADGAIADDEATINLSELDYITIDFDIWTNTQYFPEMMLCFEGLDSEGVVISNYGDLCFTIARVDSGTWVTQDNPNAPGQSFEFGTIETEGYEYKIYEPIKSIHVTYVCFKNISTSTVLNSRYFYDGDVLTWFCADNPLKHFSELLSMNLIFPEGTVSEGDSVCIDNLQICAYGNGDNTYDGDISTLFSGLYGNVRKCRDWLLYGKYR